MSISNLFEQNDYDIHAKSVNFGNPQNSAFQKYIQTGYGNTLTGACFAAPVPLSGGLYRQLDRVYSISVAPTAAVGTGVPSQITFSSPIPAGNLWTDLFFPIWVTENNINVLGTLHIAFGTGIITVSKNFNDPFSGVGITGFPGFSVTFGAFFS